MDHELAVVFDFGGVLVDWSPHYLYRTLLDDDAAIDRFLAEVGFTEWNLQQDAGRPFADAVQELSARFPHYASLIRAYDERWLESMSGPIPESVEILESLSRRGVPLYGLSNWSAEKFELVRHRWPFWSHFREIILSGVVGLVKPDPRIFTLLLERIGRQASDTLLIDDSPANIEAARKLGFRTIHFHSPEQLREALTALGLLEPAESH